ncbi:MAG TPA: LysM domain-containing protein, partial [Polyangium sp.]|nr:LysM domain-containing protein [Polyangium sp.]
MKALLMNEELGTSSETAAATDETEMPREGETGDLLGTLKGMFASAEGNGNMGQTIGGLGGAALGTAIGGPAGTAIGGALGRVGGQLAESAVRTVGKNKSAKRRLNQRERRMLAEAQALSQRTGDRAFLADAQLRVYNPVEYKKRRDAGQLPTQLSAAARNARAPSNPPPAAQRPAPAPPPPAKQRMHFPKADIDAARERANQERTETPPKTYNLQFPPGYAFPYAPNASIEASDEEAALEDDEGRQYNDTAAPVARPTPKRHLSVVPIPEAILQKIKADLPILNSLDPRFLRLATGATPGARDVSGVDAVTGQYIAAPGETAQGITKKLTGQHERTAELLASNPTHKLGSLAWNIPPGWLMYDRDTGAVMTRRSYVVQKDDTPYKIATKMGAISRPKWWAELRAANPTKTVTNGNWTSLYPNEEIGIPDEWPENPLTKPAYPPTPTNPGLPGPTQNSTMDIGVVANTQILTAAWARRYGVCDPLDFGLHPSDFSGLVDARTQRALISFQLWWNKWNPTRPMRTDGTIDSATQNALKEAVFSQIPAYGGQTPQPAPQPTPQPQPTPASPLPWPVHAGKPGMVIVTSPLGQLELPAKPGTNPGTVSITVPGHGQVDNVPVIGAFQPAPAPQPTPQPTPLPQTPRGMDGSSFPFPVSYAAKPGMVLVMTPAGQIELPYEPGTKPGTVCINVPHLGRVDNVPVTGSPASPQQNPVPQWPSFPFPFPTPPPQQQNPQPAPTNKSSKIKVDVPGFGPVEVNVEPGSKPGTVIVEAPGLGRREIPIRAGSTPGTIAADIPMIGTIDNIPLPSNIPAPPGARPPSTPDVPPAPPDPQQMPLDAHMSEQDKQTI